MYVVLWCVTNLSLAIISFSESAVTLEGATSLKH